ncbi:hypothetical protein L7F22_039493 [Adiantum nelumboides]|nr:hypothetical protein [Adiantum nelumboides]
MASSKGQSNPSTSGDAGRDHHEDFGNDEYLWCLVDDFRLGVSKSVTTSPPKSDSKKQYSEKELEEELDARLARILGAQKQGKKHDRKRKKSTNFNGYLGSESTFDKAKKHKKYATVPSSSSSSSESSSESSEEERSKKRSRRHRHGKGKRKSRSRRADDSSTADSSTDSSDSEDGHFYANKKNFYKANQYDFLEDKSKKVREFREAPHLTSEAITWWQHWADKHRDPLTHTTKLQWDIFVSDFKQRLLPPEYLTALEDEFAELKQKGMPVLSYSNKLLTLAQQIGSTEKTKLQAFSRGLDASIKYGVTNLKPATYEEALALAQNKELELNNGKPKQSTSTTSSQQTNGKSQANKTAKPNTPNKPKMTPDENTKAGVIGGYLSPEE